MQNIFHHSQAFIEKHKHHHHIIFAVLALAVAGASVYTYRQEIAQAATFTFTQSSWSGGATASTANHTSNQTGWTQYTSNPTSSGVTAATTISLPATSFAFTDGGATSTTPSALTSGGGFSNGTNSNTTISGSGLAAKVGLSTTPLDDWSQRLTGGYDTPGTAYDVVVSGNYAYVADGTAGLKIINISNPASPVLTGSYDTPGIAYDVAVSGNYAYVADGDSGLAVINISNPASPTLAGSSTGGGLLGFNSITLSGSYAYVAVNGRAAKFDISNPASPTQVGTTAASPSNGIAVSGNYLYVGTDNDYGSGYCFQAYATVDMTYANASAQICGSGNGIIGNGIAISGNYAYLANDRGLDIMDISSPFPPSGIPYVSRFGLQAKDVAVSGNRAYVAVGTAGLEVVDVSNPAAPSLAGAYNTPGEAYGVAVSGNYAYVADGSAGLKIINVGSVVSPTVISSYNTPGYADHVAISGNYAYVADGTSGIQILNISNPNSPVLSGTASLGVRSVDDVAIVGNYIYIVDSDHLYVGNIATPGTISGLTSIVLSRSYGSSVAISGNYAYIVRDALSPDLTIVDVSVPASLAIVGTYTTLITPSSVAVSGNYAYIVDGNSLKILNISNPATPTLVAQYGLLARSVVVSGNYAYVLGGQELNILNISNPNVPVLVGSLGALGLNSPQKVTVSGNYAYVADGSAGLKIINITNPALPVFSSVVASVFPSYYNNSAISGNYIYATDYDFKVLLLSPYYSSGTFISAVIDTGGLSSFSTLDYATTLNSQTISIDVRAGNTATPDGTWASWQTGVASGGSISGLAGNKYFQYRANLSTTNSGKTPTLDSVTINYNKYTSGNLTSSPFNTQDSANLITKLTWTGTGTSTTETIKFQVRSSADGSTWSGWCGGLNDSTCNGGTYFTASDNGIPFGSGNLLRSGANDQYLQYKVFLASGGAISPALTSVTATYVVNAPPAFDATFGTNGITASQVSDPASADFGKIAISYKIRDVDTSTGTVTSGYVTPSFEYNVGAGWVAINSLNLSAESTSNKVVDNSIYNTYTSVWSATSTLTTYAANAQIRVTINDNEAANNITTAASASFTLDTTSPTVGAGNATLNSSTGAESAGTLTLTATDNSTLQYRFCNDNAFPSTDTQGNSCAWSTLASSPLASTTVAWIPTGVPSTETVYLQVRDLYGNVTARTIVAPAKLSNFSIWDTSNVSINAYREFLSWASSTPATFSSYKLYHSTDGSSYSLLTTITDQTQNYYTHTITNATSSTQYYKAVSVSSNGSISEFTSVLTDIPDGSGGADISPPYIPYASIVASAVRNTSANITFSTYTDSSLTTGELATSTVRYASYTGSAPTSCPSANRADTNTYTTNHSIYLTGLTPSTSYVFCVLAKDIAGNTSAPVAVGIAGGTFTTVGGPKITGVTEREVTDISATIFWNTDTSSDSKVYYATTIAGVNTATPITGSIITASGTNANGTFYQHQIGLSGLSAGQTYYYKVTSTDAVAPPNISADDNNGQYYSFVTLKDTSPPTISNIATPVVSSSALVVVWQTDEPATSQVLYDTVTNGRSKYVSTDTTKSIYHVATLSSATLNGGSLGGTNELLPSTPYYYVVKSADMAGNMATSLEQVATTTATGNVTIVVVAAVKPASTVAIPDTTPPVVSNIKISDVTPFSATVQFDTDEESVSFVEYGAGVTYGETAGDKTMTKLHKVKLRGLILGTDYHIKVTALDKASNTGVSSDQIFKTTFLSENLKDMANVENIEQFQKEIENAIESILPSLVPPFVSKPLVTEVTESGATVSFKTNIKAFPVVVFAEDGVYSETKENPYIGEVSDTTTRDVSHTLKLTGLKGNTKYHIQARAFSLPKVIGKSGDVTFITKASKIAGSIVERKKDSFTVVWTTDEPTTSIVEYKNTATGITERKTDDAKKKSHSMKIENLPAGTTYAVNLSGLTEQGNIAEAGSALSVTTSRDVTAPVISGFKVDNALVPGRTDRIQTIVSWETDEASNGTVYYEEGAGGADDKKELANKNESLDSFVTKHSTILPNLKPGTIYRLKVSSSDDSGNEGSFGPRTVITPRQTESITDIIFKNFEDSFKFLRKI